MCDNWRLAAEFLLLVVVLALGAGVKLNVTNAISSHKIILFHSIIAPNMPDVICIQYVHTDKEEERGAGTQQTVHSVYIMNNFQMHTHKAEQEGQGERRREREVASYAK